VLEGEGIESHVVDADSILTSRRRRRAKTDRTDAETLLRTLMADNACPCEQTLAHGPAVEICPVGWASVANQNECAKMTAQILGGLLDVQEDSARDDCRRFSRPFGQCSKRMGLLRS
jgi:hypothetical protein